MVNLENAKKDLRHIQKYYREGSFILKKEEKEGIVFLDTIDTKIGKIRNIRTNLLTLFQNDMNAVLSRNNPYNRISLKPDKLLDGNYLNMEITNNGVKENFYFSENGLENTSLSSEFILPFEKCLMPYVKGLFRVLHNEKTKNILKNSLYDPLYVYLGEELPNLLLDLNGINLPLSYLQTLNFKEEDIMELLEYFYRRKSQLLKKIYVKNNTILDRYEANTSFSKTLKLYRGEK